MAIICLTTHKTYHFHSTVFGVIQQLILSHKCSIWIIPICYESISFVKTCHDSNDCRTIRPKQRKKSWEQLLQWHIYVFNGCLWQHEWQVLAPFLVSRLFQIIWAAILFWATCSHWCLLSLISRGFKLFDRLGYSQRYNHI